ncbi:ATPase family AAA domain-containing protein 5-like [Macrosteles quadrilineatus]|uniref:ATPase family AAA domain-containing protein 5-like n=1 Tax=Macrosteles quadrilineatus TaxID=74068 RepID=UPI0023E21B3E|nr:ATPase family AAA domain-containing protein 5-like [Macrosteles quadrilineatus]
MMMKNLTHYFKSPKEDEDKVEKTDLINKKINEETPPKKRKINLSKSKKKASESAKDNVLPEHPSSEDAVQNQIEMPKSTEEVPNKNSKKRKLESDSNSSGKRVKTTKPLENSLKKRNKKSIVSSNRNLQSSKCDNNVTSEDSTSKICDVESIVIENTSSCDEPLVRVKRKPRKHLFDDSDDELQSTKSEKPESTQTSEPVESNNSSCNATSRNSLFSYFNKVDKDTVLKQQQQKSSKIEVKADIHSSSNGEKIERKSVDKITIKNKTMKHKNKSLLDDSDSIELISSEEITDENDSLSVNVSVEVDQNNKISSNLNIQSQSIKSQPSNIASIFMAKKIRQNKADEGVSSNGMNLLVQSETQKDNSEKENLNDSPVVSLKANKSLKSRKSLKSKQTSGKKQASSKTEKELPIESTSRKNEKDTPTVDTTPTLNSSSSNGSKKTRCSSSVKNPTEGKKLEVDSPKAVKAIKNLKCSEGHKTPDKQKLKKCDDGKITPNKKTTINGFFSPKSNNLSNTNVIGTEKITPKAKSAWVMKVCLSASKNLKVDSDEDDLKCSQDSGKGDSEVLSCPLEELSQKTIGENRTLKTDDVVVIDDDDSAVEVSESNGRSKRSSLPRNTKKPKPNVENEEDEEVKVVEVKPQTPKPAVKMWPFFQKGGARQVKDAPVNEAQMKAKMLFLESGVPESVKRKVEAVKSDTILGSPAPFPTISHVLQAEEISCSDSGNLNLPPIRSVSPPPVIPVWTSSLPLDEQDESEISTFERPGNGNVKAFLEKLKEQEPKTEVKVLFKKLKEYKNKAESDIWTEVYKPTNSADMVGNSENIKKLKTWLETLKNCRKREGSVSSGDEFVSDDSNGDDSNFNNMAVISGPCGCGKTSAVYAIAKELDIKVLEINASCNRSGKRILAEFSESTQSHHVERSQPISGLFNNQGSGKKKRKKSKHIEKSKSEKTSLILVEDADLLFADCDEGFVPALASLAASSKRPIVLVTNQANSTHLDRFNNSKLLRITFNRPRPNKLSLWLRLVGLVEGVMMSTDLALRLVTVCNCDVRRCLLHLQLMIKCNNTEVQDKINVNRLWWGWPGRYQLNYELPTLLEPEEELRPETDKATVRRQLEAVADTTRRLALLDILSPGIREECVEEHEDPCPMAWSARWKDSTALTAPTSGHSLGQSEEAEWLQQALAYQELGLSHRTSQTPQEARWLSILRQAEQLYMPGITTTAHTNHQGVTCDYLPVLRELGRSEQVRLANYTRRANRFFNYLQGLGIHASKSYRDFMCDAFS